MTECPQITTRDENSPFITKDNLYELIPSTYDRNPGTIVTVRCADGVTLIGESSFKCESNGEWSYITKPYCTANTPTPATSNETTTTILVGAVCGVAAIIVIVLVIMLIVVYKRDKKYRESQKSLRTLTTLTGYSNREPPAPYDKHYEDDLPPRSLSRIPGKGLRRYEIDVDSQLGNGMYLPRDNNENSRELYPRDSDTTYYTGIKRPQVRPWVSRGSQYGESIMAGAAEEGQFRQGPLLWRNAAVLY